MPIGKFSPASMRPMRDASRPDQAEDATHSTPSTHPTAPSSGESLDGFESEGGTGDDQGLAGHRVTQDARGITHVQLGTGDNRVHVERLPDSRIQLTAWDQTLTLTAEQSRRVVIDGGPGNDMVTLGRGVGAGVRIKGGPGNDFIIGNELANHFHGGSGNDVLEGRGGNDVLWSGPGIDYLSGGAGDDRLHGGPGTNVGYGGRGKDRLLDGPGGDYLDGGPGDDWVRGSAGTNQVFGGEGADVLQVSGGVAAGGQGEDHLKVAGEGRVYQDGPDRVAGGKAHLEPVDLGKMNGAGGLPGSSFEVHGSAEFRERVKNDLETLRNLPSGRALLIALDDSGRRLQITEGRDGNTAVPDRREDVWTRQDGTPGPGSGGNISYDFTRLWISEGTEDWRVRPPVVGLAHEMLHLLDYVRGTLAPGETLEGNDREFAAIGLPYDHDLDPETAPRFPEGRLSERDFRAELGLPRRDGY